MKKVIAALTIIATIMGCSSDKSATDNAMKSQKEIEAKKDSTWQD